MDPGPVEVVREVAAILDRLGIPYVVGGSFASSVHGEVRFTRDADIVVDLAVAHIEPLAAALERSFYLSREAMHEAVRSRDSFNAIHLISFFKIDFYILGRAPFDREELRRRVPEPNPPPGKVALSYKTPEDTVLRKLEWFRKGGEVSEQQWKDVLGVLAVSRERLDNDYLDRWAAELGVGDLLAKARAEARGA